MHAYNGTRTSWTASWTILSSSPLVNHVLPWIPPQPSTNVLRLLEDVTPSFIFFFDRQLRYVGQSETDKSRSTLLRSCVEVSTSDNLTTFLKELGFRSFFLFIILFDCLSKIPLTNFQTCCMKNGIYRWLVFHYLPWMFISVPYSHRHESEFVLKGYYFVKGHMRITVSQVCRVRSHLCTKWINTAGPSCSKLG